MEPNCGTLKLQLDGVVGDVGEALGETSLRLSCVALSSNSSGAGCGGGLEGGVGLRRN